MQIAEILIQKGLLTRAQADEAARMQQAKRLRFDRAVVEFGYLTERQVLEVWGEQFNLPVADLEDAVIDPEVLKILPSKVVYRRRLLPLRQENGCLVVATCDPLGIHSLDDLRVATGMPIEPVLAPKAEIEKLIKAYYGVGGDTLDEMVGTAGPEGKSEGAESSEDLLDMAQEASVIKLVNEIIIEAVNERASDIHIEPYEHELSIRYRIDGVLQLASLPPQIHRFQAAIISRIKIMASLNIAERRVPQDGRIKFQIGGRQIDVRVSVIPMLFGEGIVMRLLDKASVLFSLTELGMDDDTFAIFQQLIERPHGIILVTGPTGSGKTTTLYAALNAIVGPELKVLTVEDPVEYHLHGVNQIPVDARTGMTFERGLRSILRHDPDVIMIGEIRDLETARAAIQASLTGHLVLSTLHTNDAASAPTRLIDMGIEPYLVASTLIGAMAQRLVRKICPQCKTACGPDERKHWPTDFEPDPDTPVYRGAGCPACRQTGYRGRSGLFEMMLINDALAEKIVARATAPEMIRIARSYGLRLLREDGWIKVRRGATTPEEVVKCTAV
ncbi:MAG TPA: type II secretion system ATPase GspE [Candidatus Paceibacterota bacterium]|nr:type II secretion system ATPase GspE [Verrucomicrobiota bacterium]HOX03543.1 type II secretion system ATPase GspE [Verrucomicrobiota bacterium]HRZ46408.1 type II secretion system ATPase GspE [Candidatus Paceibacterota bacterium]